MKIWTLTVLSLLITTSAYAQVKAYFNYNPRTSYSDPYRNIRRQGDNLEQVLLENIAKARKSIFVAVMEFRLPLVAKALAEKKRQGVDVRVVLDNGYNFTVLNARNTPDGEHEATKLNELKALVDANRDNKFSKDEVETRDAVYMLKAANIPVMDDSFDGSAGSGLMHHKFVIIDGQMTIVSTANFTLSCIHGDLLNRSSIGNANSMVAINSAKIADVFEEEFLQMWGNGKRGNFGHNKTYRGPRSYVVGGSRITVQFSPTSRRYNWEESVNGLMAQLLVTAKKSVVGALFVFSDQKIANVLESRHNLGVKMSFLVEAKFAFREYSELLDMAGGGMLNSKCQYEPDNKPWKKPIEEVGVVNMNSGDVLHHKFAVVDNRAVIVGSQNWSDAANFINDETAIVIESPTIADQYTQEYMLLRSKARLGVPANVINEIKRLEQGCNARGLRF